MAFYPAWQATPAAPAEQSWQNQFIQQIPQNGASQTVSATAITPLNSIDFQQVIKFIPFIPNISFLNSPKKQILLKANARHINIRNS